MDSAAAKTLEASGLMDPGQSVASHPAAPGVGTPPNARSMIVHRLMGQPAAEAPGAPTAPSGNAQAYIAPHEAGGATVVDQGGGNTLPQDDLLTAQVALKRGGADPELISTLIARAPDQAVALGKLLSERQSGADAKINRQDTRISELERALGAGQEEGAGTPASGNADTRTRTPDLASAIGKFSDATGFEESEIGPALEAFAQAIAPTSQQGGASGFSRAEEMAFDGLVSSARSELSRDHPELQTPAIYGEVEQRMPIHLQNYAHLGPTAQVRAAMRDATVLVLNDLGGGVGAPHDTARANGFGSQPPRSRGRGGPPGGQRPSGKYGNAQAFIDADAAR